MREAITRITRGEMPRFYLPIETQFFWYGKHLDLYFGFAFQFFVRWKPPVQHYAPWDQIPF